MTVQAPRYLFLASVFPKPLHQWQRILFDGFLQFVFKMEIQGMPIRLCPRQHTCCLPLNRQYDELIIPLAALIDGPLHHRHVAILDPHFKDDVLLTGCPFSVAHCIIATSPALAANSQTRSVQPAPFCIAHCMISSPSSWAAASQTSGCQGHPCSTTHFRASSCSCEAIARVTSGCHRHP